MFTGMRWHRGVDWSTALAWLITAACLLFAWRTTAATTRIDSRPAAVLLVVSILAMLGLPFYVNDARSAIHYTFFNFRIAAISYFLLAWWVGSVRLRGWWAALFVGCLSFIMLAAAGKQVRISRELAEIAPVLEQIPPNAKILPLVFERTTPELDPVYFDMHLHAPEYYHALVGGGVSPYFSGDPLQPGVLKPNAAPPAPPEYQPYLFRWDQHGAGYQYFLIRGAPLDSFPDLTAPVTLKLRSGKWLLFERQPD
jgi:hypothetical protein